jgi:hypothetical protein
MPISSAPPPLVPVRLDPVQGSDKSIEGIITDPVELAGKDRMEKKVNEVAAKKFKGSDSRRRNQRTVVAMPNYRG